MAGIGDRLGVFVLACAVLGSVNVNGGIVRERRSDPVPVVDSCMTRWLRQATVTAPGTTDVARLEGNLLWMLVSTGQKSVASLDRDTLARALGGNQEAAAYLLRCAGIDASSCENPSPCHVGVCVFKPKPTQAHAEHFECVCPAGTTGKFCQIVMDICAESTCANGGTCQPQAGGGYQCVCPAFFNGRNCQTRWLSPRLMQNMSLSVGKVLRQQTVVQQSLQEFEQRSALTVNRFLMQLEQRIENTINSRFSTLKKALDKLNATARVGSVGLPQQGASPGGVILDRAKCSSLITVSADGRKAWNTGSTSKNANVLGKKGYSTGTHRWTFQVDGLVVKNGLGVGVTTLPVDGSNYERGWSPGTVYAWFSNSFSGGLAKRQTDTTAKMHRWQSKDVLTLTLNCDQGSMEMHNHADGEKKTITGIATNGKPLYIWFFLAYPGHRVIFF